LEPALCRPLKLPCIPIDALLRAPCCAEAAPASAPMPTGLPNSGASGAGIASGPDAANTDVSHPEPAPALIDHWSPYSSYNDVTIGVKTPCQFAAAHASADKRVPNATSEGTIAFFAVVYAAVR